jgi:hypothetical protein
MEDSWHASLSMLLLQLDININPIVSSLALPLVSVCAELLVIEVTVGSYTDFKL